MTILDHELGEGLTVVPPPHAVTDSHRRPAAVAGAALSAQLK
ncbi:hypothetical protein [Streptomyces sp. NRRL S-448]